MRGFLAANTPATLILLGGHSQAAVAGALFYIYSLPEVLCSIREWVDVVHQSEPRLTMRHATNPAPRAQPPKPLTTSQRQFVSFTYIEEAPRPVIRCSIEE